jgi:hypothetical protein
VKSARGEHALSFQGIDIEHWWKLLAGSGALIAIASAPAAFVPGFVTGIGLLAIGIGEWVNHPLQTKLGQGFTITGYPRNPKLSGNVLTGIGGALVIFGVVRILIA